MCTLIKNLICGRNFRQHGIRHNEISILKKAKPAAGGYIRKAVRTAFVYAGIAVILIGSVAPVYAEDQADGEKRFVVVLDPGHDLSHIGARGNGIYEEIVNLKIAKLCKEELEKYGNVTVYLTHDTINCPYGVSSSSDCNKARCTFAASVNADLFVSLHINSNNSSSVNGYEIYYPTANYVPELNAQGYQLTLCISRQLRNVIGKNNGLYTRNSTENVWNDENFYPDGTRADYYNVIRNNKYNNILGIIVEHGYMSNRSDVANYLTGEEALSRLAKADAAGIIDYLTTIGLTVNVQEDAPEAEAEAASESEDKSEDNEQEDQITAIFALSMADGRVLHINGLVSTVVDNGFYADVIKTASFKSVFKTSVGVRSSDNAAATKVFSASLYGG